MHSVEEAYQHRNKSIAIFVRDSSTLHLRFGRSLYALYVLATLLTRSLRFHQITNINQRASSTLPGRSWRFDYVTTTLPLRSLSNPHQRKCHLERGEKQTLLVLHPASESLKWLFIIAICNTATGTIRFIFFED